MIFPLAFHDLSLLLAVTAIILGATSILIHPIHGNISPIVDKNRLGMIALILGIIFLAFAGIKIWEIVVSI